MVDPMTPGDAGKEPRHVWTGGVERKKHGNGIMGWLEYVYIFLK